MELKFAYIWLSSMPGVGPKSIMKVLESTRDPDDILKMSYGEIIRTGVSGAVANSIIACRGKDFQDRVHRLIETTQKQNIKILTPADMEHYPINLRNIYDPPAVLYVKGDFPRGQNGKKPRYVAVIGTRRCTEYGANSAFALSKDLAKKGAIVVSGMAAGIDSIAHKGALAGGGKTIAVLGCGVDICYPAANRGLMDGIIVNGCVVSEFPPGTRPIPGNFPQRNRIISGLSQAVVVVEASKRSGTGITVDFALEQGREVFAVPGNITSDLSAGTNELIKDGASPVMNADDVLEFLRFYDDENAGNIENTEENSADSQITAIKYPDNPIALLDEDEMLVYSYVSREPRHLENIASTTGHETPTVLYILTMLEMKGVVQKLPGNRFMRSL